jgi:hypothetical protein
MQAQQPNPSAQEAELNDLINQYLHLKTMIETNETSRPEDSHRIAELTERLKDMLMKQFFLTVPNIDMKLIQPPVKLFSKFQTFCIEKKGLRGPLFDFVFDILNREILVEYLTILKLSGEEQEREIPKVDGFIHQIYTCLVELWQEFRESRMNWTLHTPNYSIHDITRTVHPNPNGALLPCYLGDVEANRKRIHVFMDGQSGRVFSMLSLDSFLEQCEGFHTLFMAGVKQMTYSSGDETYLIQLLSAFFQKVGFSTERQELYMPQILSYAKKFREISGKPCVSPSQTDQETHEELQKQRWNLMEMELQHFFLSMTFN